MEKNKTEIIAQIVALLSQLVENEDNKRNGFDDHQCKSKQVFISNHFTTPFA